MRGAMPLLLLLSLTGGTLAEAFPVDSAVNLGKFQLTQSQRDMLSRNGFVVVPSSHEQLFELYVTNWWDSTPSFVTTDLMLQLFHLSVSSTLRRIEEERLSADLAEFSRGMAIKFNVPGQSRLAAFFGVASRLLGADVRLEPIPESLCQTELELIRGHAGRSASAIFPFTLDYSLFQPRGHYTRNDTLRQYFLAMKWYGTVPFPLEDPDLKPEDLRALTQDAVRMSLAIAENHYLERLWKEILEVTSFFSGPSEAYTPREYLGALTRLQPNTARASYRDWTMPDTGFAAAFAGELKHVREQRIHQVAVGIPTGPQFRLLGQRYVPDTDIMQRLVEWPDRPLPKGLDVFAALGSERAEQILTEVYREHEGWAAYPDNLAKAKAGFAARDSTFWYQNVYYAWLYALQALNEPVPKSAPLLMQNQAWQDKNLNTSVGSWSELRHDAILYAEGIVAECGDAGSAVAGYVEPNPEFYGRLQRAVEALDGLVARRNLGPASLRDALRWFRETLIGLQAISQKQFAGTQLTADEMCLIWDIGNDVEWISCRIAGEEFEHWFLQAQGTDRFIACIADVATSQDQCLEVGVAAGNTIYALVPIEGKWTLTRGAVFSYREFEWPASDRLTDEKWQQMVRDGKAPAAPIWTKNFTAGE
jgi:hypothetical protein